MSRVPRSRFCLLAGVLVVGAAIPAIAAVGTAANAVPPTLDHFHCYSAQAAATTAVPTPFSLTPPAVMLKNKFAPGGMLAAIGALSMHCNPVEKTVPSGAVTPITNPKAHLDCWSIKPNPGPVPPASMYSNQFGQGMLKAGAAIGLCLPSWKNPTAPSFPSATAPPGLDHYTCYKVTNPAGTPQFTPPPTVGLKDQFFGYTTKVGPANIMCAPTKKFINPASGGTPVVNPSLYLVCFQLPPSTAFPGASVYAKNQFGIGGVKVIRNTELCVPSKGP